MQIKSLIKKTLPHITALVIFLLVTVIYFYPVLEGKVLHTNDGTVAYNSAREIREHREKYGEEPLWTNVMFGGMPAYLISVKYHGNLMQYVDSALKIFKLPIAPVFLTMAGFYLLLLLFKVDYRTAIAGALAYGFSSYFFIILGAGHNTKAFTIAYMAPVIGSVLYSYRKDILKGSLILAFFLCLQIMQNHPQILYYTLLCVLTFIVCEFIYSARKKQISAFFEKSAVLIIPVILAAGMNSASLLTTYEYGKYSIRGKSDLDLPESAGAKGLNKEYATQWSYGIDETLTLLIPNFKGGANRPFDSHSETVRALRANNASQYSGSFHSYWGTQPWTDGPVYVGAIVVFLFIIGLIIVKGPIKWWLAAATLLSVMLAWGKNFMPLTNLFFNYFPGYNKFRAVTMILVIAEFCMPLLAILGVKKITDKSVTKEEIYKALKIALGISGGIALIFLVFPGLAGSFLSPAERNSQMPAWLTSAMKKDRMELLRADAFRSLVFIVLAAILLTYFLKGKIKKEYFAILLGILFLIDMFPVNKRYINADKFVSPSSIQKISAPSVADSLILKDKSVFRVLNLTVSPFNDATTSLYHFSVGGYHGAKLKRYNELIDSVLYPEIMNFTKTLQQITSLSQIEPVMRDMPGLNMLNTKYFIINSEMPPLKNQFAQGNAWFVDSAIFVTNANEELRMTGKIEPLKEAVIDRQFSTFVPSASFRNSQVDSISLVSYKANELKYKAYNAETRLAVFSEIYYPAGWKAYIDGRESSIIRANYVLRAMIIPPGSHEITFTFRPSVYYTGEKISLASSVLFIILLCGYIFYPAKKK